MAAQHLPVEVRVGRERLRGSAHAADFILTIFAFLGFSVLLVFLFFLGPNMGPGGPGRGLKNFLEAVRFILAKCEPVESHGGPIHDNLKKM